MAHYYFENKPQPSGKGGNKIASSLHYSYICRENKYANIRGREEDLVYKASGNLPAWAQGNADSFWKACEEYKPTNYRAYREFKFALQEELSLEDNIAMVMSFIEQSGISANHAYTFAIHDKPAAFDDEHRNIHCHLMFNEKIIEPGRALPADMYFAKYAENKDGEATCGYRTSREFISKQKTFELRTMWADIVNAKFADRGINASVDERTLLAQKEELLALGKTEEAEYFDREPAPHLGSTYRNPKTMERIREKIEQLENCPNDDCYNFDDELNEANEQDRKILAFAKDFLLRKIGKQIQHEREKLFAEMQANKEETEDLSYAVTAGDLTQRLTILADAAVSESKVLLEEYDKIKENIVKNDYIEHKAAYNALGDDGKIYRNLRIDYSKILKELKAAQLARDNAQARAQNLVGDISSVADWQAEKQKYYAAKEEVKTLLAKRSELGSKIATFKGHLNAPEMVKRVNEYINEIKENNKLLQEKAKKVYGKYILKKKQATRYYEVMDELRNLGTSTVIFATKIPPALQTYSKILGTVPLTELDKITSEKDKYYILQRNKKDGSALAVKLNDDIKLGKVPVYTLTLDKNNDGKETVKSAKITGKISTYAQNDTLKKQSSKGHDYPILGIAIERKLTELAAKIVEDNNIRIDAYWNEEHSVVHDKLQEAEHKLSQGWSL